MPADVRQIVVLFAFFLGVGLCMWRGPVGDRRHVMFCLAAAALWATVATFEPRTRTLGFGIVCAGLLGTGLFRMARNRASWP
jgi:drug/metabolite transporter (DMT)-like permease